ncbi:MAG: hypothetical protein U0792_23730 [Gemmataceae bacterium]
MKANTGAATEFGKSPPASPSVPETEFDRGTCRFGLFITQTVLVLVFFVFLTNAGLHRDPLQSLLFAVLPAVGLTPEFLPMITAVTPSAGAVRRGPAARGGEAPRRCRTSAAWMCCAATRPARSRRARWKSKVTDPLWPRWSNHSSSHS